MISIERNKRNTFEHIKNPNMLEGILNEMQERREGYDQLIVSMINQMREYSESQNNAPFVVGLSGGIDSAVVTTLACAAVGKERVFPYTFPSFFRDEGIDRAQLLREGLGFSNEAKRYEISIAPIVSAAISTVNSNTNDALRIHVDDTQSEVDRQRIGNISSRARVTMLYDLSMSVGGRVLGTGNRTEFLQGYAAKFGTPISCDFGVLDDLYKVDIYNIGQRINIPLEIMRATPSTGYYPGQTHEKELGATLKEQDAAAYVLFEKKMSIDAAVAQYGFSQKFLGNMMQRYERSAHKRSLQQAHVSCPMLS